MAETIFTAVLVGVGFLAAGLGGYVIYRLWSRARVPGQSAERKD